jgi:hypothetical protein
MKKYLNPLWIVPVLWFLIPLLIVFVGNNYYRGNVILIWILWFFWIFIMNIWNYNIININKWNYNILMYIIVIILSFFFYYLLISSLGNWIWLFLIIISYLTLLILLIGLNLSYMLWNNKHDWWQKNERWLLNRTSIPLFGIILILLFAISYHNYTYLLYITVPYFFIFIINKYFTTASDWYKIVMYIIMGLSIFLSVMVYIVNLNKGIDIPSINEFWIIWLVLLWLLIGIWFLDKYKNEISS